MSGWTEIDKMSQYRAGSKGVMEETVLEMFYRTMLTEISTNRFKWHGFPDYIPLRFVERELFFSGLVVFFYDEFYGKYFALRGSPIGPMNVYDNPTQFQAYGNGMMTRTLNYHQSDIISECVPIWANYARIPASETVAIYAKRLARIDRTIDINVVSARNPVVFKGSQNLRLSAVNMAGMINNGADFLQVTDELAESLEALNMGIDVDGFEKLHVLRARVYNECMGFLGIDNANQEKKERLIEGEVEANEEQTDVSRAVALNAREEAADQINRMYPELNLSVDYIGNDNSTTSLFDLGTGGSD